MAATRYLRSTDGSDSDNGTTWALAKASLAGIDAIDTTGDTVWISQAHAETVTGATTWNFAGTPAAPQRFLCGNDGAEPPTALAATASITASAAGSTMTIRGNVYFYGIIWTYKSAFSVCSSVASEQQVFDTCDFINAAGGSAGALTMTSGSVIGFAKFVNCRLKWDAVGEAIVATGQMHWQGGSVISGTTTPTAIWRCGSSGRGGNIIVEDFDFSNLSTAAKFFDGTNSTASGTFMMRRCKLPASWTGALISGTIPSKGVRAEMHNCDNANTNYKLWIEDYAGTIRDETTTYLTSGASDNTTNLSWKMVTTANANFPETTLDTGEFAVWNDTTGSSKTATVEFCQASGAASLNNNEIWLELHYPSSSVAPLGAMGSNRVADMVTSAAAQTSSAASWSGISTPVTQKLQVTFTPQQKGWVTARVRLCKASTTVYVDPTLSIA